MIRKSKGRYDGEIESAGSFLEINPKQGKFRLRLPGVEGLGETEMLLLANGEVMSSAKTPDVLYLSTLEIPDKLLEGVIDEGRYNPKTGRIDGSYSNTVYTAYLDGPLDRSSNMEAGNPDLAKAGSWKIPVRVSLQWNLSLKPSQAKLELTAENHDAWLPDADKKLPLKVTAKITASKGAQGRISFRFSEYGKEPGVCMNAPENDQSKAPDLVIIADPAAQAEVRGATSRTTAFPYRRTWLRGNWTMHISGGSPGPWWPMPSRMRSAMV